MVRKVFFYIEGGGNPDADTALREAFRKFFKELDDLGRENEFALNYKLGGSRRLTYEIFRYAVEQDPNSIHLLLVDSEAPVGEFGKCWKHVKERPGDGWDRPEGVDDTYCHLMVQAMEAWFFADPDALAGFYGQHFQRSALPRTKNVEQIPKLRHLDALEAATKQTQKKRYHKTRHAPELLKRLNVAKVRAAAPHCDRIFTAVAEKITGSG